MDSLAKNIKEVVSLKSGVTRLTLTDFRNYAFLRMTPGLRPVSAEAGISEPLTDTIPANNAIATTAAIIHIIICFIENLFLI